MASAAALELTPAGVPGAPAVMARARGENFPVALRLLAPADRRALLAVYGFARLADELGDELRGDRLAALDWLEGELDRAYAAARDAATAHAAASPGAAGGPPARAGSSASDPASANAAPLLDALRRVLVERAGGAGGRLPREAFARLIEANRLDQRVSRYETWEQLRAYCHLSADSVGELVLSIFGLRTPERVELSDRVCTGLQLTEHLQDLAEDLARGRVYVPREDLDRFGCTLVADGDGDDGGGGDGDDGGGDGGVRERLADPAVRELIAFEVQRARELLWAGAPLAASVGGRPKLAIAAFAGGGLAALERIERAGFDVERGAPSAGHGARLRWLWRVLRAGGKRSPAPRAL